MRKALIALVCAALCVPLAGNAAGGSGSGTAEVAGPQWYGSVDITTVRDVVPSEPDAPGQELRQTIEYTVAPGTLPDEGTYDASASYDFQDTYWVSPRGDSQECTYTASGSQNVHVGVGALFDGSSRLLVGAGQFIAPGFNSCGGVDSLIVGPQASTRPTFEPERDPVTGDVLLVGEHTFHDQFSDDFLNVFDERWVVDLRCDAPCPVSTPEACDGLEYADVQGVSLAYGPSTLATFPNSDLACQGFWLPYANDGFVPQGLALSDGTAWVVGYRRDPVAGAERCRLVQVDLDTGTLIRGIRGISTTFGGQRLWCVHGGGLALTQHGLWVSDTRYLWLLDPARVGVSNPVIRAWSLVGSVRGSFLLQGPTGRLGLGVWNDSGAGKVHWYRFSDLLRPPITALIAQNARGLDSWEKRAVLTSSAPRRAQGGAYEPGDAAPTFTSSTAGCGMVVRPDGSRRGFGPGAEDLEFTTDGRVWAVFESGSEPYQAIGRPHVPMLAEFDAEALGTGQLEGCSW